MLDNYGIRTDLALETTERFTEENVEIRGVEIHEDYNEEKDIRTTVVKITTENGARTMGRPQGNYITIEAPGLSVDAATIVHDSMAHLLEALEEAEQKEFLEEMISPHLHTMFVTPKDVDETVKYLSFTISEGLNMAFEEIGG